MSARFDVAIVGGGIVGATLAMLLVRRGRIDPAMNLLIERDPPLAPDGAAPFDLRVSAISPANRAMLQNLSAWQGLDARRIANYERMVVWPEAIPPDSPDVLRFDAAEMGEPDLGSIVENRALQAALYQRCIAAGVQVDTGPLNALAVHADAVQLDVGGVVVQAQLVVGADGATSAVRTMLGIGATARDYGQQGIVATVRGERGHQHTAWQRFLATGPLALLPLASGECSIVWSAVDIKAAELLALSNDAFGAALTGASAGVLGRISLQSERAAFPLRRLSATHYVTARCALVGDAAHVIHPLAGQGVNQGLQDALALADALAQRPARESVGAERALQRYARERRAGNALMGAMVDGLDTLFTGDAGFRTWAAGQGMALVERSTMAKRFFFTRAAAGRSSPRR
jgi:ubiquinone biosynthesis UbiH/UbiF/VisC/COQ6 family hydroxylase